MIANIVGYIKSDIVGLKNLFLAVGQPKAILKNKNPFPINHSKWCTRVKQKFLATRSNGTREQNNNLRIKKNIFGNFGVILK